MGQSANGCVRRRAERKDHIWAWNFIHDRPRDGRLVKWLTLVDEYTRKNLALEVGRGMTAEEVIDVSADLLVVRGVGEPIRSDNGPEFIAAATRRWLAYAGVQTLYIEPGSPWENGYAESFHSRLRDELLAREEFENVAEARGQWHAVSAGVQSSASAQCVGVPDHGGVCRRLCGFGLRYAQPSAAQHNLSIEAIT